MLKRIVVMGLLGGIFLALPGCSKERPNAAPNSIPDSSESFSTLLTRSDHYIKERKSQAALELLEKLYEVNPNNTELLARLGNVHRMLGDYVLEGFYYEQLAKSNPQFVEPYAYLAAVAYQRSNVFDEMIAILEFYVKHQPNKMEAWKLLAETYTALQKEDEALHALKRAQAVFEKDAKLLKELKLQEANLWMAKNALGRAGILFKDILSQDPNNKPALLGLITICVHENRLDLAKRFYDRLKKQKLNAVETHYISAFKDTLENWRRPVQLREQPD